MPTIFRHLLCFVLLAQGTAFATHMQPIKHEGLYYYNEADMDHRHIDLTKALKILGSRLLSPTKWIEAITSLFYPVAKETFDVTALLNNPTQTVPQPSSQKPRCNTDC